jgi:hypothetical protein
MTLPPLATGNDVANSLGVQYVSELPQPMKIRMDQTLAKVSRRFRLEAQRIFSPGTYTHQFRIQAGAVRLLEAPSTILGIAIEGLPQFSWGAVSLEVPVITGSEVPVDPGTLFTIPDTAPAWHVDGAWLRWDDWYYWQMGGRLTEVNYSWSTAVPLDVTAAVADIAARNLTVDPMSAVRQSKELQSRHFRQMTADWVSSGDTGFTDHDVEVARSYRYPAPPMIVQQMSSRDYYYSSFFSDSSWA